MTTNPPVRIAFCFLTAKASGIPHQAAVWERFFQTLQDDDGVFLHAKHMPVSENTWWRNHAKWTQPTVSTRWGDISIVQAMLALFDTAFRETTSTTTHFMLLSESCIPVLSLPDTRAEIAATPRTQSWLMADRASDTDRWRHAHMDPQKWPWNAFWKQHQWVLLCRDDVALFLRHRETARDFAHVPIPEEHFFASVLAREQRAFLRRLPTFVRWRPYQMHPDSFDVVDRALVQEARRAACLFLRKVRADTHIDTDAIFAPPEHDD